MCGILGIIATPGESVDIDRRQLVTMRDTMSRRGPDDAGIYVHRNISFAHRLLSIRDLSAGHQPWVSPDEQTVLVYNGEIYNDTLLRKELESNGHRFKTHCDTEVVMAAYREWGADCVHRLRGMFAIGIYDFKNDTFLLARDRFGVKPLFFTQVNNQLVFASSLPAILAHPDFVKKPNYSVLSHYMTTFRLTLGRETVYEGVWQLLPGEMMAGRLDQFQIARYWQEAEEGVESDLTFDESAAQLQAALEDSIKVRLTSDVPVGMFLSGGVDSNTIACLTRDSNGGSLPGSCGGSKQSQSDDFAFARQCAKHVGFQFGEVTVGPREYMEVWQWMLGEYATPLSTPTDVILYQLAREMKKSVGVVLGGEGADELLCGYAVQHWAGADYDRMQRLQSGAWSPNSAGQRLFRNSLMRQYGCDHFTSPVEHYFSLNSLIPSAAKPGLFQPHVWNEVDQDRKMLNHYESFFDCHEERPSNAIYDQVLRQVNLEGLLSRLDSATMLAGLEARVPYTDHLMVEKMATIPRKYKIDVAHDEQAPYLSSGDLYARGSLRPKHVLRAVAGKIMPHSMAYRPKASFPTPVGEWMGTEWHNWMKNQLLTSPFARSMFQESALVEMAENVPAMGMKLWPIANTIAWGDRQFAA